MRDDQALHNAIADYNKAMAEAGDGLALNQAIATCDKAIELHPDSAEVYYNRGLIEVAREDEDNAIQYFNKAIELDPNFAKAHYNRGLLQARLDMFNHAIADFPPLNQILESREYRGKDLNIFDEQYEDAIKVCDKAIELNPKCALSYHSRGAHRMDLEQYATAIKDFDKAIEIHTAINDIRDLIVREQVYRVVYPDGYSDPEVARKLLRRYYTSRGEAKYKTGQTEAAIKDFSTALKRHTDEDGSELQEVLNHLIEIEKEAPNTELESLINETREAMSCTWK